MKYTTGSSVNLKSHLGTPMDFTGNVSLYGTISTGYHGAYKYMTWYQSKTFRRLEIITSFAYFNGVSDFPNVSLTAPYRAVGSAIYNTTLTTKAISHNNYTITIRWNDNNTDGTEVWTFYGWYSSTDGSGTLISTQNPYTVPSSLADYQFCAYAEGDISGCPIEGTMVLMADDTLKPIEQVQIGDVVKSFNVSSMPDFSTLELPVHIYEWSDPFLQLTSSTSTVVENSVLQTTRVININNGQLITSRTHTHIVKKEILGGNIEWTCRPAFNLAVGDILLAVDGSEIQITSIEQVEGQFNVYKLNVEEEDTFVANGIITHNEK